MLFKYHHWNCFYTTTRPINVKPLKHETIWILCKNEKNARGLDSNQRHCLQSLFVEALVFNCFRIKDLNKTMCDVMIQNGTTFALPLGPPEQKNSIIPWGARTPDH